MTTHPVLILLFPFNQGGRGECAGGL